MPPSYRQINYSLRPAKTIERKLLCEAFRRLHPFGKIDKYRYVGFGSIYFTDFSLFHRALGTTDMVSIEKDRHAKECFEFNKPYRCIHVEYRHASEVLPELDWTNRTISWLDYDGKLDEAVLSDVGTVCAKAVSGSILLVSVDVQQEPNPDERIRKAYEESTGQAFTLDGYRLREAKMRLGEALPPEITGVELRSKGVAEVARRLIRARIEMVLTNRNSVLPPEQRLEYRQIFNFIYSDGASMATVGGLLVAAAEKEKYEACSFGELGFLKFEDEPFEIRAPSLTMKEIRHLNALLPHHEPNTIELAGVPASDIKLYAELYRYFPTFAEALIM